MFLCRLISDDCYEDCLTVDVYYCGGCVPLFVTMYHCLSSCVLPWVKHSCVLSIDIVPVVMEIIQLDDDDDARDATS